MTAQMSNGSNTGAPANPAPDDVAPLLDQAHVAAHALRAAGIALDSPAVPGWLVLQRLDRQEIAHASADGFDERREEAFYEQIWLTVDGELREARCALVGTASPSADSIRLGPPIISSEDISGSRWDGAYAPTSHRDRGRETIVFDQPRGPREHPAVRIAAALESMSDLHLNRPVAAAPRRGLGYDLTLALGVGASAALLIAFAVTIVVAMGIYYVLAGY